VSREQHSSPFKRIAPFYLDAYGFDDLEDDYTRPYLTIEPWERPQCDRLEYSPNAPAPPGYRGTGDSPKPQGHSFGPTLLCSACGDVTWHQHQSDPAPCSRRLALRGEMLGCGVRTAKTHCKRGHKFSSKNTKLWKGTRACRRCESIRSRETDERAKDKARQEAKLEAKRLAVRRGAEKAQRYVALHADPLTLHQRALQNMIELAIWDSVGAPGYRNHAKRE
jgi:hypothetical protein